MLVKKPDDLSSIPQIHTVNKENQFLYVSPLTSIGIRVLYLCVCVSVCVSVCVCICVITFNYISLNYKQKKLGWIAVSLETEYGPWNSKTERQKQTLYTKDNGTKVNTL